MENLKFYKCEHCGNVIVKLHDSSVNVVCCGEPMKELKPNTTEAATEKHIPIVTRDGNKISTTVGSTIHPMEEKHYIEWILLETETGYRIAYLKPGQAPTVEFYSEEPVIAVYAYCNLHGLWKMEE